MEDAENETIATMSLHFPNCLRVIAFPDTIISAIRDTIESSWPAGLREERDQARALEFKLKGMPWTDDIPAKRLLCRLLEMLFDHGWTHLATTALSTSTVILDQMFFQYEQAPLQPRHWLSVIFTGFDRVRFIDAPGDLLHAMVAALSSETQIHRPLKESRIYEFKLRGYPWRGAPKDQTNASLRIMTILQTLKRNGWILYMNIDARLQQRDKSMPRTPDAWICCRPTDWDTVANFSS